MKIKVHFSVLLILLFSICQAQDSVSTATPKTKLELTASKSGMIIKKEYEKITEIRGLEINVLTITTNSIEVDKGIYLTGVASSFLSNQSKTYVSYLDGKEVESFIKYLQLLKELLETKEPKNYTEYIFNTIGNFQGYLYNSQGAYGNNWHYGFDLDKLLTGGKFEFKEKDIDKLIESFKLAKTKL